MSNTRLADHGLAWDSLQEVLIMLGTDELRVLDLIARRLRMGQEQYGALDVSAPRDWMKEAAEEVFDTAVYTACELLKRQASEAQRAVTRRPVLARDTTPFPPLEHVGGSLLNVERSVPQHAFGIGDALNDRPR